jgi:transcriptional regulator with XRE-family HTH domain
MSESQTDQELLGAKIKRLRLERGLGQERLAIEAGIDQSGLSKFERGKDERGFSDSALERVASVLGMTLEQLVTGTDRT